MKTQKTLFTILTILVCALLFTLSATTIFALQSAVNLNSAGNFIILSKTGITTTGVTAITGNIGVSPIDSTAITGFGLILDSSTQFATSSLLNGSAYAADYTAPTPSIMTTAISDMQTAYTNAAGRTLPDFSELGAGNIGGMTLAPGLYKWSSAVTIPTDLTLNGTSTDIWVFQVAQTLDIASATHINLIGGALAKNVFWQVSGQATLGTTSVFNGIILSQSAIVMSTGSTLNGRALSQTAVTLDSSTVSLPGAVAPVLTTITLLPSSANLSNGSTLKLNITKLDQFGLPIAATITYTSSNTSVATVSAFNTTTALVTSVAAGNTTITAASGLINATSFVKVLAPVLTSINFSMSSANLTNGSALQLNVTAFDQLGTPINVAITYNSSNISVATVSASGLVTALSNGNTTITASSGAFNSTTVVKVVTPVLTAITFSSPVINVTLGASSQLTITIRDQLGYPMTGTVFYNSSNTSVATIDNITGIVTSIALGNTIITATNGSITGSANITVIAAVVTPVVANSGGGSGGGSSSSGGSGVPAQNNSRSSSFQEMNAGSYNITFTNTVLAITGLNLTTNQNATNVKFVVTQLTGLPSGVLTLQNAQIYSYLEVNHTGLDNSQIDSALIQFKVPKSWMTTNNVGESQIRLYRLTNSWDSLSTTLVSEDATNYYFQANSPGLSYFAIASTQTTPASTTTTTPSDTTTSPTTTTTTPTTNPTSNPIIPATGHSAFQWIMVSVLGLVVIGLVVGGLVYSNNQKKKIKVVK